MIYYDHILIHGKKFVLDKDSELKELSHAYDTGRPSDFSTSVPTIPSRSTSAIGDDTDIQTEGCETDVRVDTEASMNIGDPGIDSQVRSDSAELTDVKLPCYFVLFQTPAVVCQLFPINHPHVSTICLSVCSSVCLSVCPSVCPFVLLSVCSSSCLSVRLSLCPSVGSSVSPSVCLAGWLAGWLAVSLSCESTNTQSQS